MTDTERFGVVLEPSMRVFDACTDRPLLQAAREAGIDMPKSCRNGSCRACVCRLIEGRVTYRIEWPGLSAEEKVEGFILPCVAYPASALVIDAPRVVDR